MLHVPFTDVSFFALSRLLSVTLFLFPFLLFPLPVCGIGLVLHAADNMPHCLVIQLDASLTSARIQLRYTSSVAEAMRRSALLVTFHPPGLRNPTMIDTDALLHRRVYAATELKQQQQQQQQQDERNGYRNGAVLDLYVDVSRLDTHADVLDGSYGCCVVLQRPNHYEPTDPNEIVSLEILHITHETDEGGEHIQTKKAKDGRFPSKQGASRPVAQKEALSLDELGRKLQRLHETQEVLSEVIRSVEYMNGREQRMRRTTESTFTRIWVSALCTTATLVLVIAATFMFTRNILIKQKLV